MTISINCYLTVPQKSNNLRCKYMNYNQKIFKNIKEYYTVHNKKHKEYKTSDKFLRGTRGEDIFYLMSKNYFSLQLSFDFNNLGVELCLS